jgi:hypothetical protein
MTDLEKNHQSSATRVPRTVTLTGRVASGGKQGTRNTRRDHQKLQDALGARLVDGTLNIILQRPVMFANDTAIEIGMGPDASPRREWAATLNGMRVWINRRTKPLHIVGLLSTAHLRSTLHLSDGDEVELQVRECDIGQIPLVGRLAWLLWWAGRRDWIYTRAGYGAHWQPWCVRFGASQLETRENCFGLVRALSKASAKRLFRRGRVRTQEE